VNAFSQIEAGLEILEIRAFRSCPGTVSQPDFDFATEVKNDPGFHHIFVLGPFPLFASSKIHRESQLTVRKTAKLVCAFPRGRPILLAAPALAFALEVLDLFSDRLRRGQP
jgi:hypothetical protein